MLAFLLATLVYCFAFAADLKSQIHHTNHSKFFSTIAIISGYLSSVSLVAMILSGLLGHFVFVLWALVFIIIVCQHAVFIKHTCHWLHQKIFRGIFNKFNGSCLMEQPRLPV
ncbi:hypothetical protein Pint_17310 [Pistacia integerrima]|uniref:Uncharacterized protein n=1 Tax=Pistacia integerrima TaxID=434235 RepID=A0ACC0YZQ7_9ROSI|nr:hypothetical protein Pint_17310 [Pistacia integerrima]